MVCGVEIHLSKDFYDSLKECGNNFYCVNGHGQHYVKENKEKKLKDLIEKMKRDYDYVRGQRDELREQMELWRARAYGYKGQLTKAKNEIARA